MNMQKEETQSSSFCSKYFFVQTQETKLKLCSSFSELCCHNQLCQTTNLKDAGNIL